MSIEVYLPMEACHILADKQVGRHLVPYLFVSNDARHFLDWSLPELHYLCTSPSSFRISYGVILSSSLSICFLCSCLQRTLNQLLFLSTRSHLHLRGTVLLNFFSAVVIGACFAAYFDAFLIIDHYCIMDSAMLICSICPNQPDFSDISHLLTHISSKGHLAHLHRLQIKSHQEIGAGVQLANYNIWFQQNGLATLLSERMQQKEKKHTGAEVRRRRKRGRPVKDESGVPRGLFTSTADQQIRRARAKEQSPVRKVENDVEAADDIDGDYDPAKRIRLVLIFSPIVSLTESGRRAPKQSYYTPVKTYPDLPSSPRFDLFSPEMDRALDTPNSKAAKLKGKIWPGMALFDSATPDEQRRRNQKKDGSVMKRMEKWSIRVEPQETVWSSDFVPQKQRHIDNLEDASSLIEGETPIKKPKPRQKRNAMARISADSTRRSRRKVKVTRARLPRPAEYKAPPRVSRIPSSSAHLSYGLPGYSPTADENMEFQMAVGNLSNRKRTGNFTIFNDSESPIHNASRYSAYAPLPSMGPTYGIAGQPRLSYNTPWLQPQNQNPLYLGGQYQAIRSTYTAYQPYQDMSNVKDIIPPPADRTSGSEYQSTNPPPWKSPMASQDIHSSESSFGSFSGYFTTTTGLADPFANIRNPLFDAMVQYNPGNYTIPAKHGPLPDRSAGTNSQSPLRHSKTADLTPEPTIVENSWEQEPKAKGET